MWSRRQLFLSIFKGTSVHITSVLFIFLHFRYTNYNWFYKTFKTTYTFQSHRQGWTAIGQEEVEYTLNRSAFYCRANKEMQATHIHTYGNLESPYFGVKVTCMSVLWREKAQGPGEQSPHKVSGFEPKTLSVLWGDSSNHNTSVLPWHFMDKDFAILSERLRKLKLKEKWFIP